VQKKIIAEFLSKPDLGEAAGTCVIATGIMTLTSWSHACSDRRVGTFPPGVHWWSDHAVASTSSSLHSSRQRTFWTQTLVMLIFVQTYTLTCVCGCL